MPYAKRFTLASFLTVAAAGLMAGCGDGSANTTNDLVTATISLSQVSGTTVSSAGAALVNGDDDTLRFGGARIRRRNIDSLVVDVVRVDVLPDSEIQRCHPPEGDDHHGFRPGPMPDSLRGEGTGRGPGGPTNPDGGRPGPGHDCGLHRGEFEHPDHPPRPDSILPPVVGWGSLQRNWYSLDVTANGHINLLALPTDSTSGIVLASGSLPVGEYGAARLIVSSAKIYFDTTFTTATGFTFNANTAYDVQLPTRDSLMGIMSNAGFTLSTAGADIVLTFDPFTTIGHAIVDAQGNIVIRPVLKPHRGEPPPHP